MGYFIVTGASAGIGKEIAVALARRGHDLVLVARRAERLKDLADLLATKYKINARVVVADLSRPEGVVAVVRGVEGIAVTGLINNAGLGDLRAFADQDWATVRQILDVNLYGLTHLTHALLPKLKAATPAYIMNVASLAAFQPGPYFAVYCATKAYVLSFSEALSAELSSEGVHVFALCPGVTESEFHSHAHTGRASGLFAALMDKAEDVAEQGVAAMFKRRVVLVTGWRNKISAFFPRLVPRVLVRHLAAAVLRPRLRSGSAN